MIYPVDDNQLVTIQQLWEQGDSGGAKPEDFASSVWGSSNSEYNSQHRIITAQDYNNFYGSGGPTSGYANNQCVPFSAFENYYHSTLYSEVPAINVSSMGNTSGVSITHSGIVNVYVYTPTCLLRTWFADYCTFQLMVWNNKTGSSFIGERNCYLYDNIKLRTLVDNRFKAEIKAFRSVDYNYTTGYERLFTSTWYASVPSLTSTAYLSFIINDTDGTWRGTYRHGTPFWTGSKVYSMHVQSNLGGNSNYYQVHSPVQLASKTGTTTNIYIQLQDE